MNTFSLRETEPVFDRIRKDPRARVIPGDIRVVKAD
jgi:hypothetical protein